MRNDACAAEIDHDSQKLHGFADDAIARIAALAFVVRIHGSNTQYSYISIYSYWCGCNDPVHQYEKNESDRSEGFIDGMID